jgi:N-acetylglucosamine-6-phosphate deacetylase
MNDAFALRGAIALPDRVLPRGELLCAGGRIAAVGTEVDLPQGTPVIDVEDGLVAPGFVDIHVHGGGAADYMDGTVDAVRRANSVHARHGTTSIFPTTTTGSPGQIRRMIDACALARATWSPEDGARIAGVHLYGPYFAPGKVGCHSPDGRRDPDPSEYNGLLTGGLVRIATCAAELPGAETFYAAARERGLLVTCGHSNASWPEMERAFRAGMRHVDHFWCAMSSVSSLRPRFGFPMQAGMEQFVLAVPEMSTEVIADGRHLSPELLAFAYRMIGPRRLCLVTDSSRAVDCPPGRYRFGPQEDGAWFESDGKVGFVAGQGPASSVVGMDTMVRTMKAATTAPLCDVIRMASLTPAERAGIADEVGSIEPGKRADLLVLSRQLDVLAVLIDGVTVVGTTTLSEARP